MILKERKEVMLSIGMISLTIAILLERFGGESLIVNFTVGVLTGISLVLNLSYLIAKFSEKRSTFKSNKKQ